MNAHHDRLPVASSRPAHAITRASRTGTPVTDVEDVSKGPRVRLVHRNRARPRTWENVKTSGFDFDAEPCWQRDTLTRVRAPTASPRRHRLPALLLRSRRLSADALRRRPLAPRPAFGLSGRLQHSGSGWLSVGEQGTAVGLTAPGGQYVITAPDIISGVVRLAAKSWRRGAARRRR